MKEKSPSIVHFLFNELDQVLFSSESSDIKWRSVANFDIFEVVDKIMISDLFQKVLLLEIDNFDFSSFIEFFRFDFFDEFLI